MGKSIGVISIKGGVGKTTSVCNLANVLSNVYKQKVLVVDANFSAPNLRIYLGLEEPEVGIHEVLRGNAEAYEAIYETPNGFHVLPAKLNNNKPTKVSDLKEHIDLLKTDYDFILIDSSPNVNAEIVAAAKASDSLVMIVSPDYASISCILKAIFISKENGVKIDGIILNKVVNSKHEVKSEEVEEITGLKVIGVVPYHKDVHESNLKRVCLPAKGRKSYNKEYSEIAKYMVLKENPSTKLKFGAGTKIQYKNRKKLVGGK